jgi:acyl carrier protein
MHTAQEEAHEIFSGGDCERIRHFLADRFLFDANATIDPKVSLIEAGILDSTGAMELVFFLEEEFGIEVADGDLIPENLDSIERIAAYIGRRAATAR